ncbi:hypothetical protein H0H87_000868, partial [Tephrocybe sp. NHM501043]
QDLSFYAHQDHIIIEPEGSAVINKGIYRKSNHGEKMIHKLQVVCEKLDLKEGDRCVSRSPLVPSSDPTANSLLDIGCGWGTLVTYAAKNYGCDATGCTLSVNQAAFGTERIKTNGVSADKARIICSDYRDLPAGKGAYNKIVSLEMAEVRVP